MSRSKNHYQGMSLGRVQRSEYNDAKMRDLARHDARLEESLKTVERAKNVMKKSMEAEKQLFMKAGSQSSVKSSMPAHGAYRRSSPKSIPQFAKLSSEPRVKRFSVTDMPSDLARSTNNSGRVPPRPISIHELNYQSSNTFPGLVKEQGSFDKLSESNLTQLGLIRASNHHNHTEIVTTPGTLERFSQYDPNFTPEGNRRSLHSTNRSPTETSKHCKAIARTDSDKTSEYRAHQRESNSGLVEEVTCKSDDHTVEKSGEIKNQRQVSESAPDQDQKPRKRSTLWETLSTPKHTSLTKSKRNQIELEFAKSGMKSYKSSPALFSTAKAKPTTASSRPPLPRSGSVQVPQVDFIKGKQSGRS